MLVKSPTEIVVGTLRTFGLRPDRTLPFALAAAGMGQNLMSPPNVKGWPGGETWINTTTLLARKQFVDRLTRADGTAVRACRDGDVARPANAARQARSSAEFRACLRQRGIPGAVPRRLRGRARTLGGAPLLAAGAAVERGRRRDSLALVRGYVLDAAYQLK